MDPSSKNDGPSGQIPAGVSDAVASSYASSNGRESSYAGITASEEHRSFPWDLVKGGEPKSLEAKAASEVRELISLIKRRAVKSMDGKILIPDNFFQAAPLLAWKMQAVADNVDAIFLKDPGQNLTDVFADALSLNEETRTNYLNGLVVQEGKPEYESLCALYSLCDFCREMPDPTQALNAKGGHMTAFLFMSSIAAGIWCEMNHGSKLSESNQWWTRPGAYKEDLINLLTVVWKSEASTRTLVSAFEILLRRQMRKAMTLPRAQADVAERFNQIAKAHIELITAPAGVAFVRKLRKQTIEVFKEVPDLRNRRSGATRREKTTKTVSVRPHLPKGPSTPWEAALVGRINSSLSKFESGIPDFQFKHSPAGPKSWMEKIGKAVDNLYGLTASYAKIIASRKREVRGLCLEAMHTQAAAAGKPAVANPGSVAIPLATWERVSTSLAKERGEQWEAELIEQARILLGRPLADKEELTRAGDALIWSCIYGTGWLGK